MRLHVSHMIQRLLIVFTVFGAAFGANVTVQHCAINQQYDEDRYACLDRCGANNNTVCDVSEFCSSTANVGPDFNPPICLSHCTKLCITPEYCDHKTHRCMPCEELCDQREINDCRRYCYAVFINRTTSLMPTADTHTLSLSTAPSSEQSGMCQRNQFYDDNKAACRDRCGHDTKIICNVGEFCSSTIITTVNINPPVCINLCNETCREGYFCDPFSYTCRQCEAQCVGSSCHLYCDEYSEHSTTTSQPCAAASGDCPPFTAASGAVIAVVGVFAVIVLSALAFVYRKLREKTNGPSSTNPVAGEADVPILQAGTRTERNGSDEEEETST